jgi:hypothetical protein
MSTPSASNPLLHWDPAAADPAQRRIHPILRGAVLDRDGWTCRYCGAEATEVDHVDPRARGGATTPANLVAACRPCNKGKGIRTPGEWRRDKTYARLVREIERRRAYRRPRPARADRTYRTAAASSCQGPTLQKRRARPEVEGRTQACASPRRSGWRP